jgi:Methylenetetrahydrofolate reductase
MFLEKIKSRQSGILLYGITPPKEQVEPQKVVEIAEKTLARLHGLDIDALVVYDVQDESARTAEERPFPFLKAYDPFDFAKNYLHSLEVPKIIYRPASKFTQTELSLWLEGIIQHGFSPVFVGVPAPDFQPITSLPQAYQLWHKYQQTSVIGAVTIPERHAVLKDEDQRILDKMASGVSYFISQCVFDVAYTKQMIDDLVHTCSERNIELPTIIFTLTACGSIKTLHFMEWLGIHIPETLKSEFKTSENLLTRSVEVCTDIADELITYCHEKGLPFGFNIESVAIRKDEIEASIAIVNTIREKLIKEGLRK